jgi:Pyruvate/2-oxoacid:ferredoxin oxidoreductase delta subunit
VERAVKFAIDEAVCIDCGACRRYCPVDCIPYRRMQHQVDLERCIGCTICYAVCPADAVLTVPDDRPPPNLSFAAMEKVRVRAYRRGPLQLYAVMRDA